MKTCNQCKQEKNRTEFYREARNSDGLANFCKPCKNAKTVAWREKNQEKYNEYMREKNKAAYPKARLRRYGITPEQHEAMLKAQNGLCAICLKPPGGVRPLATDHSHNTKQVRGLLCYGCNRAISILDKPELFEKAMRYIGREAPAKRDHRTGACKHPAFYDFGGEEVEGWCDLCRKANYGAA